MKYQTRYSFGRSPHLLAREASGSSDKSCSDALTEIDAFLYGLPGGFILAGVVLLCFIMFGNALTAKPGNRGAQPSASSNTRLDRKYILGKKNKRGPPPSADLRPMDINQLALRDDAPDDIKAMAGKFVTKSKNTAKN